MNKLLASTNDPATITDQLYLATLSRLPGCSLMRVAPDRALIVLEPHQTPADLEIVVMDRLASRDVPPEERAALRTLSRALRRWRRDHRVKVSQRAIVVLQGPA